MFCPNCGNNCGDAKFCVMCGTKIQQAPVAPATQTIVTVCPHCGGLGQNGIKCSFCGRSLVVNAPKHVGVDDKSYSIPCGFYKGVLGSLTLYEKECIVKVSGLFKKTVITTIPYDKITAVVYERSLPKSFANGNLLFRWEGNKDIPIPPDTHFTGDNTSISTSTYIDTLFYHIFYMLKAVAPRSAVFRMVIPDVDIPGLEEYSKKANLEDYYEKYKPLRAKAVAAFCSRTGAKENIGKVLIDRVFDAHQQAIYEANPMEAIRDLNLVVQEKIRNEEEAAQARAQRREQYAKDDIRIALEERRNKQE